MTGPNDPNDPKDPDRLDDGPDGIDSIDPEDEREHYGDQVLGKALRVSLVVGFLLAGVAGAVYWFSRPEPKEIAEHVTPLEAPVSQAVPEAAVPRVRFTDVTESSGVDFVHNNGATGEKLLPETMGGGVAVLDYDQDGDSDLLFVNSDWWPEQIADGKQHTMSRLYRNDGRGQFTDATQGSGLDTSLYGMGASIGDYDGDGDPDLFLTAVGENRLYRNLGNGQFEDVTRDAGVAGDPSAWSTGATWLDVDRDGDLDLFVCNYIRWNREIDIEIGYSLTGIGRAYGPPTNFEGSFASLYINQGDGTFADRSAESGVQVRNPSTGVPAAKSLAVCPTDFDGDGWMDLVIANDTVPNHVFRNRGDGTFEETGARLGIAFDSYGNARGAMGIDSGYVVDEVSLAVAIGNFANEMSAFYLADQVSGTFADEAIAQGIGPATRQSLTFGLFFFDYDLDGWLDLLQVNGHLEEEIQSIQESQSYEQSAQLFWNAGASGGGFKQATPEEAGSDLFRKIVGRGSAYADFDDDGDLDVVFTQVGGSPLLLRNDQATGHHWIRIALSDPAGSNRFGIGAEVTLHLDGATRRQRVLRTRSYLSQSEPVVTFGLGTSAGVDSLEIVWPDGKRQAVRGVEIDRLHRIERQEG